MKIVVLCGGLSSERDVSLASGAAVTKALRGRGHAAAPVDLYFGYKWEYANPGEVFTREQAVADAAIGDAAPDIKAIERMRLGGAARIGGGVIDICRAADIVFIALHGQDGEDGKIQALFDLLGIKYTGTGALGSALGMDKALSKYAFYCNGVRSPYGEIMTKESAAKGGGYKNRRFPLVVKPLSRGSSVGVTIADDMRGYREAIQYALRYDDSIIAERYISGREFSVGILRGRALPVIEICPKSKFFDYRSKYQSNLTDERCPADIPEKLEQELCRIAKRVFKALRFEVYARIDFIVENFAHNNRIWCLEGNTVPGLTPVSLLPKEAAAAGVSYEDLCEAIVKGSMRKYKKKPEA
jgi:D-alanine-D-alanine ligase